MNSNGSEPEIETETKIIHVSLKKSSKPKNTVSKDCINNTPKPKKKRVITGDERVWNIETINNMDEIEQLMNIMESLNKDNQCLNKSFTKESRLIQNQISQKISSYRSQDIEKGIFDIAKFIHLEVVIQRIIDCHLKCYYCKESMKMLYEYVREPKQWTVERIDNSRGHNCDNIEIACLNCNLRRRTMYHERYIFTKQVKIVKEQVV